MNEHELFDDELATRLRGLAPDVPADDAFGAMLPRFEQAKRRRRAGIASAAVAGLGSVAVVALLLGGGPSFTQDVRTDPASGGRAGGGSRTSESTSTTLGSDNGGIPGIDNSGGAGNSGSGKAGSGTGTTGSGNSGSGSNGSGSSNVGGGSNSGPGTGTGGGGNSGPGGGGGNEGPGGSVTTTQPTNPPPPSNDFDKTYTAAGGSVTVHVSGTTVTVIGGPTPASSAWTFKNDSKNGRVDITFEPVNHQGSNSTIVVKFNDGGDFSARCDGNACAG